MDALAAAIGLGFGQEKAPESPAPQIGCDDDLVQKGVPPAVLQRITERNHRVAANPVSLSEDPGAPQAGRPRKVRRTLAARRPSKG